MTATFTILGWATVAIGVHFGIRWAHHRGIQGLAAEFVGMAFGGVVLTLILWGIIR